MTLSDLRRHHSPIASLFKRDFSYSGVAVVDKISADIAHHVVLL